MISKDNSSNTLVGCLIAPAYMVALWGFFILHIWGVIIIGQVKGSLLGILSFFVPGFPEVYVMYKLVTMMGWTGSPYACAGLAHLICIALIVILFPFMDRTSKIR